MFPNMYLLQPEVAGGLGLKTMIVNHQELEAGVERIPQIKYLEYVFDGWLGDSILASFPIFIVTEQLANDMSANYLSGVTFENVEISKSDLFIELHPNSQLPQFMWMQPNGKLVLVNNQINKWSGHDVCLNQYGDLIVTKSCMNVLRKHSLNHCDINEIQTN